MLKRGDHIPVIVDDRPSTLVSARWDYGLIAIGIRKPGTNYNQGNYPGIVWFSSLAAALPSLKQLYDTLEANKLINRAFRGPNE